MCHLLPNPIKVCCLRAACVLWVLLVWALAATGQQFSYQIYSQPVGIIATASNTVSAGTIVPIPYLPYGDSSGNYYFGYWTVNGVRQSAGTGASFSPMNLDVTNNLVAVAIFVSAGDSSPGLPDWYQWFWFGNTNQTLASDPTGDGFAIADDIARDYCPVVANVTVSGGAIMRLSDSTTFIPGTNEYYYQIQSQPQGIISTTSGYVPPGTRIPTPDVSYGPTSGYDFGYWTINGLRQAGVTGASLTAVTLTMTNDETAVADFFSPGDTSPGLPDWYQWFWFGNTNQTLASDPTGDGFAIADDIARDYCPVVANVTVSGGAIMRLSDSTTFIPGTNEYYYQIQSQPQGIISTTSGYVPPGTRIPTPDVSYGPTSGYDFGYWTINGLRQAGVTGASLTAVTLTMTNDETAVADFFSPGDTSPGLPDWYQWFWFGNTNQTLASDPTGDGFAIADDITRDYSPVIANVTINGGAIMRLSDMATLVLPPSWWPTITNQPASQTVAYGLPASFTVGASGEAPLFYQWYFNGVSIAGANESNFTIPSTILSSGGNYQVVVTNILGSATSAIAILTIIPPVQSFTNLHDCASLNYDSATGVFTNSDGFGPRSALTLSGNTLFGTASEGGSADNGAVFKINSDGTGFTNLHSFTAGSGSFSSITNTDGAWPVSGLILAGNTLFGTAESGGSSGNGTLFRINSDGTGFANLHSFSACNGSNYTNGDGAWPQAGLILSGNTLYGTAEDGGSFGFGTVFAINTNGASFVTLHNFTGGSDGAYPVAALTLSGNTLYGTAYEGGSYDAGTVFVINTDGTDFTNLYNFSADNYGGRIGSYTNGDGAGPQAGLILSGSTLYGTASQGGSSGGGTLFAVNANGTGFTNLYNFADGSDGSYPVAGLILSGTILYGTTEEGGSSDYGILFAVNNDGTGFTTLHSFAGYSSDGAYPMVVW